MKKILLIVFSAVIVMSISSCNTKGERQKNDDNSDITKIEAISDSLKRFLKEQDSLSQGLVVKIDTIALALNNTKTQIETLKSEINEIKSPGKTVLIMAFVSFLLGATSIVLIIILFSKKVGKREIIDVIRGYIDDPRTNLSKRFVKIEFDIKNIKNNQSNIDAARQEPPIRNNGDNAVNTRLQVELEKQRKAFYGYEQRVETNTDYCKSQETIKIVDKIEQPFKKSAYALIHTGKYLVNIVETKQESCVYSLNFISDESAEFDIISLEKIKTINDLKDVIDIAQGSCLLEQATNYVVIEKGKCKKFDDNTWEVVNKLVIKVSK